MSIEYIGDILYDEHLFKKDIKIVIFGAGRYGKRVLKYLEQKCIRDRVICFCDSDNSLKNVDIMGIPVWKPIEVCQKYPYADYLICGKYAREMYDFLKENEIDRIHILVW